MENETFLWFTRPEAKFIISLSFNKKKLKNKELSKKKIFNILGWDTGKVYWNQAPIFDKMIKFGVFKLSDNKINGHNLVFIDFDRLDEIMDQDPEVRNFRKIGWTGIISDPLV